jgi:hypothetical protein
MRSENGEKRQKRNLFQVRLMRKRQKSEKNKVIKFHVSQFE